MRRQVQPAAPLQQLITVLHLKNFHSVPVTLQQYPLQRANLVNDRLRAYREDLAEWLSRLFDMSITEANLLASIGQFFVPCSCDTIFHLLIFFALSLTCRKRCSAVPPGNSHRSEFAQRKQGQPASSLSIFPVIFLTAPHPYTSRRAAMRRATMAPPPASGTLRCATTPRLPTAAFLRATM